MNLFKFFSIFLILMYSNASIATMMVHQEIKVLEHLVTKIEAIYGHPKADSLESIKYNITIRSDFLKNRLKNNSTYILINIASQNLIAIRDDKIHHSQKITTGKDVQVFSDILRYAITKPYLNVKASKTKKIIDMISKDVTLVNKLGYELLDIITNEAVLFDVDRDLNSVRVRQRYTEYNALANVKFVFDPHPLRSTYLHDAPTNDEENVMLSDVDKFNMFLFGEPLVISPKLNASIKLESIPVHIIDWEIYVDSEQKTIIN